MNNKISTAPLAGFMELLPQDQLVFERFRSTIVNVYELYGFTPIDTPIIERAEVLLAKAGGDTEKQIYRFSKGKNDLALRFDLTVPLARYVSEYLNELVFPFRRYAVSKVFRGERPQRGRFREFYQADIDIIGRETLGIESDAEIAAVICHTFTALGIERFTLRINNRKLLTGLLDTLCPGIQSVAVLRAVDKLEKVGTDNVIAELVANGIGQEVSQQLLMALSFRGSFAEAALVLAAPPFNTKLCESGVTELLALGQSLEALKVPAERVQVDLSIARGLDYYTGTVYETKLDDYPEFGSVCSGGRYDNLASQYCGSELPGVGISIGLTRLFDQLRSVGIDVVAAGPKTPVQVVILPMMEDNSCALSVAAALRAQGVKVLVYSEGKRFKEKLKYADRLQVPFAVIIGEDEITKGAYALKDLRTGQQWLLSLPELIQRLV